MARARRVAKRTKRASEPWVDDPQRRWRELTHQSEKSRGLEGLARKRRRGLEAARKLSPEETPLAPVRPGESNWVELGPTAITRGQTWTGARVLVTGRVTDIAQHPSDPKTIYVAAARGGVWKTTDGGVTWTPKSDHELSLAIGALAIARSDPNVLYAGTGEGDIFFYRTKFAESSINATFNGVGILKTADGGNTWTLGGYTTFLGACFYRIAVDPTNANIAYAASNLGLYRTRNGGTSWQQITSGLPAISSTVLSCCDVVVDPTNRNVVYVAFWADGVYKTTNAATVTPTWTKIAGGFPTTDLTTDLARRRSDRDLERLRAGCVRLGRAQGLLPIGRQRRHLDEGDRGRRGRRRLRRVHVERRGRHLASRASSTSRARASTKPAARARPGP